MDDHSGASPLPDGARETVQRGPAGRKAELAALDRLLAAARAGHPSIVLVEGASGMGKTALVEHFLHEHSLEGQQAVRVHRANGVRWENGLDLGVAEQLAKAAGATLAPELDPVAAGHRLQEIWNARRGQDTLVVVIDDAHWADAASLQAVASAVRRMSTEPVLVILLAADDRLARLPVDVLDFLAAYRDSALRLGPLTPEDVQGLAWSAARIDLSLAAARILCRHTRGNPLHITDLLQEVPPGIWRDWQPALPAPRRYASAVQRRLEGCGDRARTLVEACAALGESVPFAEAAELSGVADPLAAVDEACDAGLLTRTDGPGLTLLTFPHPLVRAAVHGALGLVERGDLHRRAAETVEDHGRRLMHRVAATPAADAELADDLDRFAADRAAEGAWSQVAGALVAASRLSPARTTRRDRLLRAVDALVGAGDRPQAETFAAELESFPPSALRDSVLGYLAITRGRPEEAEVYLTHAWERCDPVRRPELAAAICQRRVLHSLGRVHPAELVHWARKAVDLVGPMEPSAVESEAILGLGLAAMGRPEEAAHAYDDVLARISSGAQSQRVQMGRGWMDLALDDPEAARRELEGAVPTGIRGGSLRISLWAQAWLARTQFALGAWSDALRTADRATAQVAEARMELLRPLVHWTGAQIHALRGNWPTAYHHARQATADMQHYEAMVVPACLARAQVAEARGQYERVTAALEPVLRLRHREGIDEPGFWPWQDVYANALVMTNRVPEADAFLRPFEELAADRGHRSTMARLGYVRGRIAGTEGDLDAARAHFEGALAHLEHLPLPYDRARVSYAYGQTLRRAGKRKEADALLQNARDAYVLLGARTYVERCERELQAGGLKRGGTEGTEDFSRLTAQERAVARLVARGMSNGQVASELFLSVKTVQYHLTHVYAKVGVRSRGELAAVFRDS
ncbi:helix-turn-helix transcriptional regulator [Streptomyces purpurogeneiscleroticus]|uniref:helix-turn-helix transcriptional regulator n=1 Tax=Streptomyces purpurogeneiscleroticus TaxID=68259 RepID=UPI001CBEC1F5|nr:LuxR family transcriptional regulator [Streptomyces purpurogeneiscleroticus]MBZ4015673.1 LuxR family transcriptional regulator [Streptomyces purpurogeneiscleroticus]